MTKMPVITAKVMIDFLIHCGFRQVRQRGSHKFFRHYDGRTAVVPEHQGEDLGRGITNTILNDTELKREDFLNWYHN